MKRFFYYLAGVLGAASSVRIILDKGRRLNHSTVHTSSINMSINKEDASRAAIFSDDTPSGIFLEVGCGRADLRYLLGVRGNLVLDDVFYSENKEKFEKKFQYWGLDLKANGKNVIGGDICSPDFLSGDASDFIGKCAVVYSNNVFEHLKKPWVAAHNMAQLLQKGGVGIVVVPFAQRYHESPGDYFRYTHTGVAALFDGVVDMKIIESGYDILGRRNDWQGSGAENDTVPVDEFGAWRETWFTYFAFQKL